MYLRFDHCLWCLIFLLNNFLTNWGKNIHRYITNLKLSILKFRFVCCQCRHLTYHGWYLVCKFTDHLLLIDYHVDTKTSSFSILKTSAPESMHPKILHPYTSIYKTLPTINEILMYLLTNLWYLDKTMTDQFWLLLVIHHTCL